MAALIKVGLTGGIGTGKSTVAQHWQRAGAALIDADQLAHETLAPDTPTWMQVVTTFGEEILKPDRTVNRPKLGEIVFGNETKRLQLNQIVHPAVHRMWLDRLAELSAEGRARVAVVAIPLLFEIGAQDEFDWVVVVACSEQSQLARLRAKGLTQEQALARIRAQWPLPRKMDHADFVIWNDGALETLQRQADIIWARMKENHHAPQIKTERR
jgi:dephospho-CoA kinase